jgi:hypothetical protein
MASGRVRAVLRAGNFSDSYCLGHLSICFFQDLYTAPYMVEWSKVVAFRPPRLGRLQHCPSYFLQILV